MCYKTSRYGFVDVIRDVACGRSWFSVMDDMGNAVEVEVFPLFYSLGDFSDY